MGVGRWGGVGGGMCTVIEEGEGRVGERNPRKRGKGGHGRCGRDRKWGRSEEGAVREKKRQRG